MAKMVSLAIDPGLAGEVGPPGKEGLPGVPGKQVRN